VSSCKTALAHFLQGSVVMQLRRGERFYSRYTHWWFLIVKVKEFLKSVNRNQRYCKNKSGQVFYGTLYSHNTCLAGNRPVSEMTYTVSSGTLNSTIPYHTWQQEWVSFPSLANLCVEEFFSTLSIVFLVTWRVTIFPRGKLTKRKRRITPKREALVSWISVDWWWFDCRCNL